MGDDRHASQEAFGRGGGTAPQDWATPWVLFRAIERRFGRFDVDVCADAINTKVPGNYYTAEQDGLKQPWSGRCWANPPYSSDARLFAAKAVTESRKGVEVVMLTFVRSDTRWWHETVPHASQLVLLKGRVNFERPGQKSAAAPMASCLIVFTPAGGPPKLDHWDWHHQGQTRL